MLFLNTTTTDKKQINMSEVELLLRRFFMRIRGLGRHKSVSSQEEPVYEESGDETERPATFLDWLNKKFMVQEEEWANEFEEDLIIERDKRGSVTYLHGDCNRKNIEHVWNGCVCERCGRRVVDYYNRYPETKPIEAAVHDWNNCTCRICGEIDESAHAFENGACACSQCKHPSPDIDAHKWKGCVCKDCGVEKHEWCWNEKRNRRGRRYWQVTCDRCGKRGLKLSFRFGEAEL